MAAARPVTSSRSGRGRPSAADVRQRRQAVLAATAEPGSSAIAARLIAIDVGLTSRVNRCPANASRVCWTAPSRARPWSICWFIRAALASTSAATSAFLSPNQEYSDSFDTPARSAIAVVVAPRKPLAANSSAVMAQALLEHGRRSSGALAERYLADCMERDLLPRADPARAFELLYGLTVQDTQIRCLLGEAPPDAEAIERQAAHAVRRFVHLLEVEAGLSP